MADVLVDISPKLISFRRPTCNARVATPWREHAGITAFGISSTLFMTPLNSEFRLLRAMKHRQHDLDDEFFALGGHAEVIRDTYS